MNRIEFGKDCMFVCEGQALSGVKRVASQVRKDISLVTDYYPGIYQEGENCKNLVIYGTIGFSPILESLEIKSVVNLSAIRGKREVYCFQVVSKPFDGIEQALVIAGSDKRGTIYGLYHLSELLGVSPLVNWNHVIPPKRKNAFLTEKDNMVSKEPSVKYRGFFINDEWPAFGTWAQKHFGGINAACYERVFELLLRLKGNYLWPAMWNSNFSMDGPGIESARLADELGVVMSTSHHEPCMRSGEEYTLLRGKDSIYGDAWNFRKNEKGVTRFWKDGLLRNKAFENVITLGMRGERDSAILGQEATLEDNINLLRDVLKTQNQLIREIVCEDLNQVPRQIVLFSEVEEFFYGNEETKGLKDDPELDGVTLMLSDNNYGCTRTLPTEEMRSHKGGYGMYYHMDMHGGAYSYEWIGSTYLPRVWEQMTQAYEFGVSEIWVTNVGDIGTQEYGLSFFLDLAYDIEKWGGRDCAVTVEYTKEWVEKHFAAAFTEEERDTINQIIWKYTGLLAKRKHEVMNVDVYHPLHFGEADKIICISEEILELCQTLKKKCAKEYLSAFMSLLYYPACGTANLMKTWILAGKNKLFATQNRMETNILADQIMECIKVDENLVQEYHSVDGGYYDGFGLSEHMGFTNWNDEDCKFPILHTIIPANQPRMLVARVEDEHYMTGLTWCNHPQVWKDALRPDVEFIDFDIFNGSDKPFLFEICTDCPWISFSKMSGEVRIRERIRLKIHRVKLKGKSEGSFQVKSSCHAVANIGVEAENKEIVPNVFLETDGYIAMEASHYTSKWDSEDGSFLVLSPYGRTGSAIKVYPCTADFINRENRPYVEYAFLTNESGIYNLCFYLAPTTPVVFQREQYIGFAMNDDELQIINTVKQPEIPFFFSRQWSREAMDNIKLVNVTVNCKSGRNVLRFFGMSPAIVLERIVLFRQDVKLPESYLGPKESYFK